MSVRRGGGPPQHGPIVVGQGGPSEKPPHDFPRDGGPSPAFYLRLPFLPVCRWRKAGRKTPDGFSDTPPPRGIRIIRYRVRALLMEKAYLIRSLSFLIIPKLNLNYHLYRNLKARFEHPTGWRPPHETDVKISGGSIPLMTSKEMRVAVGRLCVCRAVTRRAPDESEALRHSKR